MYKLYKSVFNNIYLFNLIYKFVRLYEKNKFKQFFDIKSMVKYEEREYIESILFTGGGKLKKGDFPNDGVLKEIEFYSNIGINCKSIPYGVEVIKLSIWNTNESPLIELPSSVHTITNVYINNKQNNFIPPNIKSISFLHCPNISGEDHKSYGCIVIPNTIKEVNFSYDAFHYPSPLRVGDIPFGVTSLEIHNLKFNCKDILPQSLTSFKTTISSLDGLNSMVLPNSLINLDLYCNFYNDIDCNGFFNFLNQTTNCQSLVLDIGYSISKESNLYNKNSIKNLKIKWSRSSDKQSIISPNSLPPNLENLYIFGGFQMGDNDNDDNDNSTIIPDSVLVLSILPSDLKMTSKGIIPKNVKSLTLNHSITEQGTLPNNLTSLNLTKNYKFVDDFKIAIPYTNDELVKMISILPKSLCNLTLPKECKLFNLQISNSIAVNYLNNKLLLN